MGNTQGVRLEQDMHLRLKSLGEFKGRSMNYLIQEAVGRYLDDEEHFEKEKQEDQQRLQHFLDTGEHVSNDRMKAKLEKLIARADNVTL